VACLPFVFIFREPASNSNLEPRERRVRPHVIKKQQKLSKDRHACLLQVVRMSPLLPNVALHASDTRLNDLMHERREICEHVERGAEVSAQLGALGYGIGEDRPDPGNEETTSDGRQAIWC